MIRQTIILGLDLSLTAAGYVILDVTGPILAKGTIGYSLPKSATMKDRVMRLLDVAGEVCSLVEIWNVTDIACEGYAFGSRFVIDGAEVRAAVFTQLWVRCAMVPVVIPPTSARKRLFGESSPGRKKKKTKGDVGQSELTLEGPVPKKQRRKKGEKKPLSPIKEWVAGKIKETFGLEFEDHNVADAFVIAEGHRAALLSPETGAQQTAVKKRKGKKS